MLKFKFSFGEIIVLQEDIAEVIIDEGVEFNIEMVAEYHEFLINKMKHKFSLLINKKNPYTYTFTAQQYLGTLEQICSMAVVVYNKRTEIATNSLISIRRESSWKINLFNDREIALGWLQSQQKNCSDPCNRI